MNVDRSLPSESMTPAVDSLHSVRASGDEGDVRFRCVSGSSTEPPLILPCTKQSFARRVSTGGNRGEQLLGSAANARDLALAGVFDVVGENDQIAVTGLNGIAQRRQGHRKRGRWECVRQQTGTVGPLQQEQEDQPNGSQVRLQGGRGSMPRPG